LPSLQEQGSLVVVAVVLKKETLRIVVLSVVAFDAFEAFAVMMVVVVSFVMTMLAVDVDVVVNIDEIVAFVMFESFVMAMLAALVNE
jgi:hypothetical protein